LTAVLQWMPESEYKTKVVNEVLSGQKKMCLAITEAFAGSDVAGLRTTATLTPDGKHYIIRGTKVGGSTQSIQDLILIKVCRNGSPTECSAITSSPGAKQTRAFRLF
jgi:alkylation response protein AidB-like acyl-CoA dehydrogenase